MILDLSDYRGPLGAFAPALARRRIAVAADRAGRICLVRPDSVVLEFEDERGYHAALAAVAGSPDTEVLDALPDELPPTSTVTARLKPKRRPRRWSVNDLEQLLELVARSDQYRVRPHLVYLGDGVARHFRLVGDGGSAGTPGLTNPAALHSTVRPAAPPAALPLPLALKGRRPPNVLVLDTGLRTMDAHTRAEHPWLREHCEIHQGWRDLATVGRWDDEDEPDDDRGGRLDFQAGHGTFISGIIRQLCPDARVFHRGVLTSYGDGDDASVIVGILRAHRYMKSIGEPIDIVVMAFGTYGTEDEAPAMSSAVRLLQRTSLVVAAAGNDATTRPFFPAALPGVVAVGALDGDGPTRYSNRGAWVDACAPASDIVSTFFTDVDDRCECCGSRTDEYRGWARWSGTSFAAPKVAGVVAQEMYLRGGTAREAWARLSGLRRHRRPDLGVVFNV